MTTFVHYIYRAAESTEGEEVKCETWPGREPLEVVRRNDAQVGKDIGLLVDHPEQQGEKRTPYKVTGIRQAEDLTNVLIVSVTDPDKPA